MHWKDAFMMAKGNLIQTPLRTSLTIGGVIIGIASLVCMFAFGLGLQKLSTEQIARFNFLNSIRVYPGQQRMGMTRPPKTEKNPTPLDNNTIERIRALPGVASVNPVIRFPMELKRESGNVSVFGSSFITNSDRDKKLYPLGSGTYFSSDQAFEVIVSLDFLSHLGPDYQKAPINKMLVFSYYSTQSPVTGGASPFSLAISKKDTSFKIVGVLQAAESAFDNPFLRTEFLLPLGTVQALGLQNLVSIQRLFSPSGDRSSYNEAEVTLADPTAMPRVEKAIKDLGLRPISLNSILKEMNQVFLVFNTVLGAIGSISLFVAALGIINTMIIAIMERRKEIGIMKSVGATCWDIKQNFFVEATVIGITGGILGLVLGKVVSFIVNYSLNIYFEKQGAKTAMLFYFPWWILVGSVAFAVAVSLASALYPASRAARLDPVESLRYE